MKKPITTVPFLMLLSLLSVATLFTGCKKDEKDDDSTAPKSYRITSVENIENGETSRNEIHYTADNKILKFSEIEDGIEIYRNNWDWSGNEVTITEEELHGGTWIKDEDDYSKLIYAGGHLAEYHYYMNDSLIAKNVYSWNGNLLTGENWNFYTADTITWDYTINYIYEGARLISAETQAMGLVILKQVIEYKDGAPFTLKTYNYENVLQESTELLYTNGKITTINNFKVTGGVQGGTECTETRVYNANNCATNINLTCIDDFAYTSTITYEEGASNFNDFLLIQVSWISVYLFPDTFPSELAYKKKKK